MSVSAAAQSFGHPLRQTPTRRAAFTLVEMVIAIAVIVVLAALTVTAAIAVIEKSEVRQTENILKLLDLALQEWKSTSDRAITWGKVGEPYDEATWDMTDGTPHVFTLSEVLRVIGRSPNVKEILAQIDPEFVYTYDSTSPERPPWIAVLDPTDPDPNAGAAAIQYDAGDWDGTLAVLDAWGRPIRAVHAGRLYDPVAFADDLTVLPDEVDPDGTIRLETGWPGGTYSVEEIYGTAHNRRIRFVSAGPDGRFGSRDEALEEEDPLHKQSHDNVVSYPVEHE